MISILPRNGRAGILVAFRLFGAKSPDLGGSRGVTSLTAIQTFAEPQRKLQTPHTQPQTTGATRKPPPLSLSVPDSQAHNSKSNNSDKQGPILIVFLILLYTLYKTHLPSLQPRNMNQRAPIHPFVPNRKCSHADLSYKIIRVK